MRRRKKLKTHTHEKKKTTKNIHTWEEENKLKTHTHEKKKTK